MADLETLKLILLKIEQQRKKQEAMIEQLDDLFDYTKNNIGSNGEYPSTPSDK